MRARPPNYLGSESIAAHASLTENTCTFPIADGQPFSLTAALFHSNSLSHKFWSYLYRRLRGIDRRMNPPIGKSVSVSFRVRVVLACERARRSCVGVCQGPVRGECLSTLGPANLTFPIPAVVSPFACLLLFVMILMKRLRSYCYTPWF